LGGRAWSVFKTQHDGSGSLESILGLLKSLKIRALHSSTGKHVVPVWSLHLMIGRKEMHQLVEDNTLKKVYFFKLMALSIEILAR
jgi:hypothetical protein